MSAAASNFPAVLGALAPIFLLIALGRVLRRFGFPGEEFWSPAERLTYYVLFPSLLLRNLATADLRGLPLGSMAAVLVGAFLFVSSLLLGLRRRTGTDGPGFTSVFQGGIRMNTYVGIAGASALFGNDGIVTAAVAIAVIVPLVNVLSVTVLYRHAGTVSPGWAGLLAGVARNPLILACAAGILLNLTGAGLPPGSEPILEILGRASLPLGLLAVGAGLGVGGLVRQFRAVGIASVVKLVVLPLIAASLCHATGLTGIPAAIVVLFSALPAGASSYILARQLGGDGPLMATILTAQTVIAAASLPASLSLVL